MRERGDPAMDFYTVLSNYYDDIFQKNEKAIQLIREKVQLKKGTRLLDLAAGTGEEAIELSKLGFHVTATDMNDQMVEMMKSKTKMIKIPLVIEQMDMNSFGESSLKSFDGIYCIGNSFVHLSNREEMIKLLDTAHEKLNKGGVFIIQIVNYDRILSHKINELPVIENKEKGLTFERLYKLVDDDFRFQMRLTVRSKEESKVLESETSLTPLVREDVISIINASKFSEYDLYGSFSMTGHTIESPALIAVLTKR